MKLIPVGCNLLMWKKHTLSYKHIRQYETLKMLSVTKPLQTNVMKSKSPVCKNYALVSSNDYFMFDSFKLNKRAYFTSQSHLKKKGFSHKQRKSPTNINASQELDPEDIEDPEYSALLAQTGGSLFGISSIAVLQPWVKWGADKRRETSPQLLLDEACSLVKSLPSVNVTFQEHVPLQSISKSCVFGSGTMERLVHDIHQSRSQAVFISLHQLTRVQKSYLEEQFKLRVFDRYFIVLAIFKHHASTVEARLQIAMAELPMMSKAHLNEKEKIILHEREAKLKEHVKRLTERRGRVRATREKSCLPSVAVVGYTNCGKTTLIRALTGDEKIQGENRLFATLDVTAHKAFLPCGLGIVLLDSVGFIQDIPTKLIASFNATLQDVIYSDVVVLVRDISHPDLVSQTETVFETLDSLFLPKDIPIVVVNNKVDLLQGEAHDRAPEEGIFASSITGEGLTAVIKKIQTELLRVTGRKMYRMKLLTGSPEIDWLKNTMGVSSETVLEDDPQYTELIAVMNEAEKAAFRKAFK